MKYLYLILFITSASCSVSKHTYICGDRPCVDKKEIQEYFVDTFIVEVQTKNKKKSSVDLVKLNTEDQKENKRNTMTSKLNKKLFKTKQNSLKKEEKQRIKQERRMKKIEEKNRKKEEKKIVKLRKNNNKKKIRNIINNDIYAEPIKTKSAQEDIIKVKKRQKTESFKSTISKKQTSICEEIKDCDIDKIAELLIKKGREKKFPDIGSK